MAKKDKAAPVDGEEPKKSKRSKKKLLIIAVVVLALLGAGGYFFLGSSDKAAPKPGTIVQLDPININLAGGHYLKVGLALQAVQGASHDPEGPRALDIMISTLSNRSVAELSSNPAREKVKAQLLDAIEKAYHHEVMDIYFTEFVMQ
jgi:flagellar protein FliL